MIHSSVLKSPSSLAGHVIPQVRSIALEVAKEKGVKAFCNTLACDLEDVRNYLESPDTSPSPELDKRILKVLDYLQLACEWPARPPSTTHKNTFDRDRYQTFVGLLQRKPLVKKSLKNFATAPNAMNHRNRLRKHLQSLNQAKKTVLVPDLSELERASAKDTQDDYQVYVRMLYDTLASHCLCHHEDGGREITANLRLNECCSTGDKENTVDFRLLFLGHPHDCDGSGTSQWQDARVCVSRKRGIRMTDEEATRAPSRAGRRISVDKFCETITKRTRLQLQLAATEGGLVLEGSGLSQGFAFGTTSISLADLLSSPIQIMPKTRLLLSCILAKSAWQFYDSEWMQREWTKETVHFMFERRENTTKGIFLNEPFLSVQFGSDRMTQREDQEFQSHLFPKILALGILFLEIELGIDIANYRSQEDIQSGTFTMDAYHIAADEVFKSTQLDDIGTFAPFKAVIETCLYPDKFTPFLDDPQELRRSIEEHILSPLRNLYKLSWEDPAISTVRPVMAESAPNNEEIRAPSPMLGPVTSTPHMPYYSPVPCYSPAPFYPQFLPVQSHIPSPRYDFPLSEIAWVNTSRFGISPSLSPLPDSVMSTGISPISSDDWFQELDKLNTVLRAKRNEQGASYRRTRVAVLDTGVSEGLSHLTKRYKDFVSGEDDDFQDNTGHGTKAVQLITKVYNMADIYVGRVFENDHANENTTVLMAQAIRHAKNEWKADIMVLPSGFRSYDRDIEIAIEEARKDDILIFAAASNYSNFMDIVFPGRLYIDLKLFCMFSTDASVRASPNFNPSVSKDARYSFAILGENIGRPLEDGPCSGTSFATMIGAAVAARILDFSRQQDISDKMRLRYKLKTVEGMSTVFSKMVQGAVDNGYHCMAPWKILPPEYKGADTAEGRLQKRTYVCETISRALETKS